MPAQLLALTEGPSIFVDKPILLFGRDLECDIRFDSRKISRKHCCIAQVGDHLVVRDLGSTNGIRINGVRVAEGKLKAGDELTIGSYRYQVRWDELAMAPAPRPVARESPKSEPASYDATAQPGDDDVLEKCDEPVPLAEPDPPALAAADGRGQAAPPLPSPHLGERKRGGVGPPAVQPPPPAGNQESFSPIVPEQIQLAPASGEVLPIKGPQPPSSHSS